MPRTLIGLDAWGYGCVKIMKSSADSPVTTPDSDRGKFLYNSKLNYQTNLCDITVVNTFQSPVGTTFYPPGTNASNYDYLSVTAAAGTLWAFRNQAFNGLRYNIPLFDVKAKKGNGSNRYNQQMIAWTDNGAYYRGQGGFFGVGNYAQIGWSVGTSITNTATYAYGTLVIITPNDVIDAFNKFLSRDKRVVVWNLPGNGDAIDDAPVLAPNGNKSIKITATEMKIAKPGYNVDTATIQQMAFDASRAPVKVLSAGDIALPAGVSFYETGITLPDTVALDVHFYNSATIMYPSNPQSIDFGAEYWFDGTKIYFDATTTMRARFMLYLEDTSPPTGGSNKVLRQFNEGGVDVVQLLRPGSADPPAWPDIIVDTRRPQVQILAHGHFAVGAGNDVITDIPFDGTGMFPMVKYITEHGPGNGSNIGSSNLPAAWTNLFRLPFVKLLKYVYNFNQFHAGESTYCELTANNVRFHTFAGNVGDYYNRNNSPGTWQTVGAYPPIAIRYYVFGIPQ